MTILPPQTLLEEFLLLAMDDQTQQVGLMAPGALDCATAGAILMDLALRNRIDNDLRDVFTVDATPTGDDILDPVLKMMSLAPVLKPHPIAYWLRQIADEAASYRDKAMARLEKRGATGRKNLRAFWVFGKGSGPRVNQKDAGEIKARLLRVVLTHEVPTPRDVMLISLAGSCGLFARLLTAAQADAASARIAQVARLDLIGQAVAKGMSEIQSAIALASGYR